MINKLRQLRKANGSSLGFVSYKSGISQSTLAAVECGARKPSVEMLYWYCVLFNANADDLLDNKVDSRVHYYKTGGKPYKAVTVGGRQVREHRAIMERLIGRSLLPGEVVHHKDGNKLNNSPDNLMLMKKSDHSKIHCNGLTARRRPILQLGKNGEIIKQWVCAYDLRTLGYDGSNIQKVCAGKWETAYGYKWKYL